MNQIIRALLLILIGHYGKAIAMLLVFGVIVVMLQLLVSGDGPAFLFVLFVLLFMLKEFVQLNK
jgi:hypothetical protein